MGHVATLETREPGADDDCEPGEGDAPIALNALGLAGKPLSGQLQLVQRQMFRREGEYWTVEYDGAVCRLKDTKGMQFIAHLLRCPGQRVRATQLLRGPRETEPDAGAAAPAAPAAMLGTTPPDRGAAERARVNVTRAIKAALQKIGAHHPALCAHLSITIRTGNACVYLPDPRLAVRWETFSAMAVFRVNVWDEA